MENTWTVMAAALCDATDYDKEKVLHRQQKPPRSHEKSELPTITNKADEPLVHRPDCFKTTHTEAESTMNSKTGS